MTAWPDTLFELAFIPRMDEKLQELAALAEPEEWVYHKSASLHPRPILYNYMMYTYKRLAEEGKIVISDDGQQLTFNTGLVTSNQEPVFALFNPNRFADARQRWHFRAWSRKGQCDLNRFAHLPEMAHYVDDPAVLVFDNRKELRVNVEHILADNRSRFPEPYCSMQKYALQTFLKGAIDNAREGVRRNYKTAIPQYYRRRVQLLLPLCLAQPGRANLALVVESFETFYRACTCITLDMAYNNARQLARPDRHWLQP